MVFYSLKMVYNLPICDYDKNGYRFIFDAHQEGVKANYGRLFWCSLQTGLRV